MQPDGDSFATLIRNKDNKLKPFRLIATVYSTEVKNIAFDIMPISDHSIKATEASSTKKPKRRSVLGESLNSVKVDVQHAVFRREVQPSLDDDSSVLIEKNVSLEDDNADTKTAKLIASVHKSKKLTAK